jgi:hypothetical protein
MFPPVFLIDHASAEQGAQQLHKPRRVQSRQNKQPMNHMNHSFPQNEKPPRFTDFSVFQSGFFSNPNLGH